MKQACLRIFLVDYTCSKAEAKSYPYYQIYLIHQMPSIIQWSWGVFVCPVIDRVLIVLVKLKGRCKILKFLWQARFSSSVATFISISGNWIASLHDWLEPRLCLNITGDLFLPCLAFEMLTGHTSRSDQAGQTHGRHFSHTIKVTTPAENMGKQLRTSENI